MQEIRAVFKKQDCAIYISHLDLMRCISRAVRRAGIPIWYTEGFNPHPFFTFALPLSLGQSSECETMDFKITADMPYDEIVSRFNECLPQGITVVSVAPPVLKHTAICYAGYTMDFSLEQTPAECIYDKINQIFGAEQIFVEKRTKTKQIKQFDFKQCVKEYSVEQTAEGARVKLILPAGCVNNVNPSLLEAPVAEALGTDMFTVDIHRTAVYTENMELFS